MQRTPVIELTAEERHEVATWLADNGPSMPEPVRRFLSMHERYLTAGEDLRRQFDSSWRELRRALGITPSSEKRQSGSPLSGLPREARGAARSKRQKLEERLDHAQHLRRWHGTLVRRHGGRVRRFKERLANMRKDERARPPVMTDIPPVEEIELTAEEEAAVDKEAEEFVARLRLGGGPDPAMASVNETLMPAGSVLCDVEQVSLPAVVPADLAEAEVVETLSETRVRHDFSVTVKRIELEVEKKVLVDADGERHVITASTSEYGPAGWSVTWDAWATLAVMVAQFALPFHRLGKMLSTAGKTFTTGSLSRMFHEVAQRIVPIYLELALQLPNVDVLAGDDTSCRVLEVSRYFAGMSETESPDKPPWWIYRTPADAEASVLGCEELRKSRIKRREDGDRTAKPTSAETPSLGMRIGSVLAFESQRRSGDGAKRSLHTTVVSGRTVAADPRSLVVLYRSHLGGYGNLLESILEHRDKKRRNVVLQGDLSSANFVTSPELLKRFNIKFIGCGAHARRPFALYEDEDPDRCAYMLHLFLGLALDEQGLDAAGRNRENVLAVRRDDSRPRWAEILDLARDMTEQWSPASKLGDGARYIIKHFGQLTAYLDDPRLEPSNNLRERMLRMEKLIEGASMFRRSLEGRFALDVVRTVLQTAVAAGVPVHEYLVAVLRASDDVAKDPARFTPRAWAEAKARAASTGPSTPTR